MKEKSSNIFKEYWYLWVIVLIIPPLLYICIQLPWGLDAIGKENAPQEWLNFWGGYLGAIISAGVAFFILNKQLKANAKENEENRKENEKQNEENRKLQLKTIEYNRELQALNDFKIHSAEYINLFQSNHIMDVANIAIASGYKDAFDCLKTIVIDGSYINTKLDIHSTDAFFEFTDNHTSYSTNEMEHYTNIINDIQSILFYGIYANKNFLENLKHPKSTEYITQNTVNGTLEISDAIKCYVDDIDKLNLYVIHKYKTFINVEQERINKILLD